jgi:hypothetical protein
MQLFLSARGFVLALAASGAGLVAPTIAKAQYGARPRQPEQPQVQRQPVQCAATVKQVARGLVQVATDAGEQWVVRVEARPQDISFTGSADSSFLRTGMWVRFNSKLTKRGQATEPLTSLTLFTPREGQEAGVRAETGVGGGAAAGLFEETKPDANARPKGKSTEDVIYLVAGQITKISRQGELTVSARGTTVKADLADNVKISLDLSDLSYLRAGDKFDFEGWHIAGQNGQAVATRVNASAAQPLGEPAKKKAER